MLLTRLCTTCRGGGGSQLSLGGRQQDGGLHFPDAYHRAGARRFADVALVTEGACGRRLADVVTLQLGRGRDVDAQV